MLYLNLVVIQRKYLCILSLCLSLASCGGSSSGSPAQPVNPAVDTGVTVGQNPAADPGSAGNPISVNNPVPVANPDPDTNRDPIANPNTVAKPGSVVNPDPIANPIPVVNPDPAASPDPIADPTPSVATVYRFFDDRGRLTVRDESFAINESDHVAFIGVAGEGEESRTTLHVGDIFGTTPRVSKLDAIAGIPTSIRVSNILSFALDEVGGVTALLRMSGSREETAIVEVDSEGVLSLIMWSGDLLTNSLGESKKIFNLSSISRRDGDTSFIARVEHGNGSVGLEVAVLYSGGVLTPVAQSESTFTQPFFAADKQPTLDGTNCNVYLKSSHQHASRLTPRGLLFIGDLEKECPERRQFLNHEILYKDGVFSEFVAPSGSLPQLANATFSIRQAQMFYKDGTSIYTGTIAEQGESILDTSGYSGRSIFHVAVDGQVTPLLVDGETLVTELATEEINLESSTLGYGFAFDTQGYMAVSSKYSDEHVIAAGPTRSGLPYADLSQLGDAQLQLVASSSGPVPEPKSDGDYFSAFYDHVVLPEARVAFVANVDNPLVKFTVGNVLAVGSNSSDMRTLVQAGTELPLYSGGTHNTRYLGRDTRLLLDKQGGLTAVLNEFSSVSVLKVPLP